MQPIPFRRNIPPTIRTVKLLFQPTLYTILMEDMLTPKPNHILIFGLLQSVHTYRTLFLCQLRPIFNLENILLSNLPVIPLLKVEKDVSEADKETWKDDPYDCVHKDEEITIEKGKFQGIPLLIYMWYIAFIAET